MDGESDAGLTVEPRAEVAAPEETSRREVRIAARVYRDEAVGARSPKQNSPVQRFGTEAELSVDTFFLVADSNVQVRAVLKGADEDFLRARRTTDRARRTCDRRQSHALSQAFAHMRLLSPGGALKILPTVRPPRGYSAGAVGDLRLCAGSQRITAQNDLTRES